MPPEVRRIINIARVLIDNGDEAVNPMRARELGIEADILFIRGDGYTLGAQHELRDKAYAMWRDEWTQFYDRGEGVLRPISEYESYVANAPSR